MVARETTGMTKLQMRMIGLVCALVLAPSLASAQKTPDEWYKEGETQYNLGNFEKAIEAFKQGFSLETTDSKKSAYLYNIAQSYRQAKDCSNAQFFYKRFLALRDADANKPLKADTRREVEERIKELEECARNQEAIKNRPPDKTFKPDEQDTGTTKTPIKPKPDDVAIKPKPDDGNDDDDNHRVTKATPAAGPRVISARLFGGGAKIRVGGPLDVPVQATFALIAG
jgi:tetratricopeptide (TPR) repeat protein